MTLLRPTDGRPRRARWGIFALVAVVFGAALAVGLSRGGDSEEEPGQRAAPDRPLASARALTLRAPANGVAVRDPTPVFTGTARSASGASTRVTVALRSGTRRAGAPLQTVHTERTGGSWSAAPQAPLAEGVYNVSASQETRPGRIRHTRARIFTVDVSTPQPTIAVAQGARPLSGRAGDARGDSQTVTVELFAGEQVSGAPLRTVSTTRAGSSWSLSAIPPLAAGRYTARVRQTDLARHVGTSPARGFTVPALAPGGPYASYRDTVLRDRPSGYWRLGESPGDDVAADAARESGGARYESGVVRGRLGTIAGDADRAAGFDGSDDHVTADDADALDFTRAATIEVWVKRSKSSEFQVIVGKPGDGQSKFENYALWLNEADELVAYFGNGKTYAAVESGHALDARWHHVVATYASGRGKLYIDGGLDATVTSRVRLTDNDRPLNIGRAAQRDSPFGGEVDEVAVYPRALSALEVAEHFAVGSGSATTGPAVTLTTPESGTTTVAGRPAFAGQAGVAATDSSRVRVSVHRGSGTSGAPVQTLTARRRASGSWTITTPRRLAPGTYTARARQRGARGTVGVSAAQTFTVARAGPAGDGTVLVGAGDIAYCDETGDEATAALLDRFRQATVFTLGDNAYEYGTASEFQRCYDPTWGRAKARTRPSLGDHDYGDGRDPRAPAYFRYFRAQLRPFGRSAIDSRRGYYSYEAGAWHVVTLNAICGSDIAPSCDAEEQLKWLADDLEAHPASCTLALLSAPRFSSGSVHGNNVEMRGYWRVLHRAGVELVLSGDDHDYERFAPQDPGGTADLEGTRQIVVGTGGRSHYPFRGGVLRANSEVRNDTTYGVLRLVLRPGTYEWEFVPEAGRSFTDSGSDQCH